MTKQRSKGLSYADAGVDTARGERIVERIAPIARATHGNGVLGGIGGFGALFELPLDRFKQPVLVSGADGVGTKLRLAIEAEQHSGVGIDLVAMCANDILVHGAEPLYFLDYYASGRLAEDQVVDVIASIARGCELAGAALIGGETAEMPDMYQAGDYDLAGFCVGIVERSRIIGSDTVRPGQVLLGLAASGLHSNGFSLVRKVLSETNAQLHADFADTTVARSLLTPTRIYVRSVLALLEHGPSVHAIAHITGGGLTDNIPRVLPRGTYARLDTTAWRHPAILDWLAQRGGIAQDELRRTFNCGIGMIVCVAEEDVSAACAVLEEHGEHVTPIGTVQTLENASQSPCVVYA